MKYTQQEEFATEIKRQESASRDYIIPASRFEFQPEYLTSWAHEQLAEKLRIPQTYYQRMLAQNKLLLAQNVNAWLQQDSRNLFIREQEGKVRAILSDRYKPISNLQVCRVVSAALKTTTTEYNILRRWLTDHAMYLTIVSTHLEEIDDGDYVGFGIMIMNSEVGYSRLVMQTFMYRAACENGMIFGREDVYGCEIVHYGRQIPYQGVVDLDKLEKELGVNMALASLQNAIQNALQSQQRTLLFNTISKAQDTLIPDTRIAVELLGERYKLPISTKDDILSHIEEPSQYGLANAVTRTARDCEIIEKQIELEELGGKLLMMPSEKFQGAFSAASPAYASVMREVLHV